MWRFETLSAAIARTNGRSRGFDYLRIILACSVVLWHSIRHAGVEQMSGWLRPTFGLVLPMFFALSGFLISGSLIRSRSIHEFIALRAMRIIPALAVETVLSALLIGSIFTTLPWGDFIASPVTHAYLLNIVGYVHFHLPGVFGGAPVNQSLWTIPYELECYLLIVILWVSRIVKSRWAILAAAIAMQIAIPIYDTLRHSGLATDVKLPGRVLVLSFMWAVTLFAFRERVKLSWTMCGIALAIAMLLLLDARASYLVALPAAYVTIFLGLRNPPKIPVIMDGDYSYGIYLYAYPIQMAVGTLLPQYPFWWVNFGLSLILASFFAAFSWHVVEKPVLAYRKRWIGALDRAAERLTGRRERPDPATVSVMDEKAAG